MRAIDALAAGGWGCSDGLQAELLLSAFVVVGAATPVAFHVQLKDRGAGNHGYPASRHIVVTAAKPATQIVIGRDRWVYRVLNPKRLPSYSGRAINGMSS